MGAKYGREMPAPAAPAGTSAADWLTAVGTVGATILALFGIDRTWLNRPRLNMETDLGPAPNADQDENFTRYDNYGETPAGDTVSLGESVPSVWVRARVTARRGRADAAEVVVLGASIEEDGQTRPIHVDGRSLCWSGYTPARTQLDLSPGLPRRIDIATVVKGRQSQPTPLVLLTDFRSNNRSNIVARGRLTLSLAAVASNGPPTYYEFVLDYDGLWPNDEPIWSHLRVVSLKRLRRLPHLSVRDGEVRPSAARHNRLTVEAQWVTGAFGLGGVVVGGLITGGTGWLSARRRAKVEARVGAQLLRRQLQTVARSISQAIHSKTWGPTRSLSTTAWDDHQAALSVALTPRDWIVVASAIEYIRTQTIPILAFVAPGSGSASVPLTDEYVENLRPLWEDCRKAFVALHRASDAPPEYRDIGSLETQLGESQLPVAPMAPHHHAQARGPLLIQAARERFKTP